MIAQRQVPQLAILREATLFVSHGGMGGTMESLSCGTPLLLAPQVPEQEIVADRVVELGLGQRIGFDITAGRLRALLTQAAAGQRS